MELLQHSVNGGTAPLTYSWNTSPVQTTDAITGLFAGDYTVTVTDATGCTGTTVASVVDGAQITSTTTPTDVSCYGLLDGSATASGTSGVAPYTYNWDVNNLSGLAFCDRCCQNSCSPVFWCRTSKWLFHWWSGSKELTLVRGITYYFDVNATGFPFMITSDPNGGDTLSIINSGVTK